MKRQLLIICLIAASIPLTAASASSVAAASAACVEPVPGIVSWWTGDGHGSDAVNGMDATLLNGAGFVSGLVDEAMHFDGTGAYAVAPAHPSLASAPAYTLEFWFRPTRDIVPGEARVFPLVTNGPDYTLDISNADSQLEVRGPVPRPASGSRSWLSGIWYHIAITYTYAGGYVMYIDGVAVGLSPDSVSLFSGAVTLTLAWEPGTLSVPPTPGDLDEITIYDHALSAGEIAAINAAGAAGKCKQPTFDVTIMTFIPGNSLEAPFFWRHRCPQQGNLNFRGDTRGFDPHATSYRTLQTVTVVPGDANHIDGIKDKAGDVKESKSYAADALPVLDDNDDDSVLGDCHLLHGMAEDQGAQLNIVGTRPAPDVVRVEFEVSAGNPLVQVPGVFKNIDYTLTLVIDASTSPATWHLSGREDGFPAIEIYVNEEPLYQRGSPPPYTTDDVLDLMPLLGDKVVNMSGTLT